MDIIGLALGLLVTSTCFTTCVSVRVKARTKGKVQIRLMGLSRADIIGSELPLAVNQLASAYRSVCVKVSVQLMF